MTFISSSDMRQRDIEAVEFWTKNIDPVLGYALSHRGPEGGCRGMMFSYNLQKSGRPDLIITGTMDTNRERHRWVLNTLLAGMLSKLPLENKYDYALDLNRQLCEANLNTSFVATVVNTEQWINGFGFNHKRFYKDIPVEELTFIQIIEIGDNGEFPVVSTNAQVLIPTVNYSQKEPLHASVLSNSSIPCRPDRESHQHLN